MITSQQVKDYLGIDYADEMVERNIERLIKVADSLLVGSIGKNYNKDDPRAEEMALIICDDLYSQRGMSNKVSASTRQLITDLQMQLRIETSKGAD